MSFFLIRRLYFTVKVAFGSRGWEAPPPQYVRGVPAIKRRQDHNVADNFYKLPRIEVSWLYI